MIRFNARWLRSHDGARLVNVVHYLKEDFLLRYATLTRQQIDANAAQRREDNFWTKVRPLSLPHTLTHTHVLTHILTHTFSLVIYVCVFV